MSDLERPTKVGDLWRKGDRTRGVVSVRENEVYYTTSVGKGVQMRRCWITTWNEWCRRATRVQEGSGSSA